MIELAATLEATALAQFLKRSAWVYPLVNAGHILGIALLVGAVVPMDLRFLGIGHVARADVLALLRPVAASGLCLAAVCGVLLFVTQAGDYVQNRWFWAKISLVGVASFNALAHLRIMRMPERRQRVAATVSLALWPTALICGRMIAYS